MSDSPLEPGFRLGKYEVVAHIATGGMGAVYRAKDLDLGRTVAIKVLANKDDLILRRFRREARHAAQLSHPNIVTLFEYVFDTEQGLHYLVMEFIDGIDLAQYIVRRGKLQPEEARRILIQVTKALDHAHSQGVVHRDIKPPNILLAKTDEKAIVKLADLGLSRGQDDDDFKVTREGNTVGTIDYLPPEQARDSASADIRSDIYALGCTAYHMLAGKAPFAEGGLGERLFKHLHVPPTDVRQFNPEVSLAFWSILQKMLAKDPADRFATPGELLLELKQTPGHAPADDPEPPPPTKRRRKPKAEPIIASPVSPISLVSADQAQAAAKFHERAVQVLAEGGGETYVRELLTNCLKLDPFNTTYRKSLRDLNRTVSRSTLGRWFGSLNVLAIKSKRRLSYSNGDWRSVIEHGEEVLAHQPLDVDTHLEMADAAEKLHLPDLARWFLEQARTLVPESVEVIRALARFHESRQDWKPALAFWQKVREAEPTDYEAGRKINDLSAQDLLANAQYKR